MVLDPQRYIKRNTTKLLNKVKRGWTSITVKDGTIYRIDDKMYQVFKGRYNYLGQVCHMCDDLDEIKQNEIINY